MAKSVIKVDMISKKYLIGKNNGIDLRSYLSNWFSIRRNDTKAELWALKNISFEVKEGEILGIVGPNGSGKSTLLKILSKITQPTKGTAIVNGKVSSLLEVGTGFHPELTGRQNIFLNGSILGMKRSEILKNLDQIIAFSELEKFIDTPVKHYSTGMYMRLAFSVAAHLDPDILLIDEVLSVGDLAFRKKSLQKMTEIVKSGKTILFVSHNLNTVKSLCKKGIFLKNGNIQIHSNIEEVLNEYTREFSNNTDPIKNSQNGISLRNLIFKDSNNVALDSFNLGDSLKAEIVIDSKKDLGKVFLKLEFKDQRGNSLFECNSFHTDSHLHLHESANTFLFSIERLHLNIGEYLVDFEIYKEQDCLLSLPGVKKLYIKEGFFYPNGRLVSRERLFLEDFKWEAGS